MGWLVVEPPTPLKNDGVKVSWDDDIPNILEKCSKPPTRYLLILTFVGSTNLAICCVFSVWFAITQPMAESIITSALTKHFFLPATNVGFQHPSGQASSQKNHGAAWWFEGIPIPVQND